MGHGMRFLTFPAFFLKSFKPITEKPSSCQSTSLGMYMYWRPSSPIRGGHCDALPNHKRGRSSEAYKLQGDKFHGVLLIAFSCKLVPVTPGPCVLDLIGESGYLYIHLNSHSGELSLLK